MEESIKNGFLAASVNMDNNEEEEDKEETEDIGNE